MIYRKEIDGLRAIAVLAVIAFHAGFDAFAGGYAGVDVFFVISGYLITSIIRDEKQAGSFSLLRFYERRARRILAAMFFVMLACLPFAWLWMLPAQLKEFGRSMVAVSIFSSNILFGREAGYFAAAADQKPLLHTWSLAVEEQYYVLFPLFVLLVWPLGRRWLVGGLVAGAMLSLGLAEWGVRHGLAANFFFTPARGWELLLGSVVSFCRTRENHNENWHGELASLFGFALITYAVFMFDRHTPFPGRYALVPTVGAALIILYATPATVIGRLLGQRHLVSLGLVSYSTYLWHQPLFAFARIRSLTEPAAGMFAALGGTAFLLGYLTWRFVEQPFRDKKKIGSRTIALCAAAASATAICIGIILDHHNGFDGRFDLPAYIAASFKRSERQAECVDRAAAHSRNDWLCRVGSSTAQASFLVYGDSHAFSFLPAFDAAANQTGSAGSFVSASGCVPLLSLHALRSDQHVINCHALSQRVLEYAFQTGIKKVFLIARWTYYTDGGYDGSDFSHIATSSQTAPSKASSREAFVLGLNATAAAYRKAGIDLLVLEQVPQQRYQPQDIYFRSYEKDLAQFRSALRELSIPLSEHRRLQVFVGELFASHHLKANLRLVSFESSFCDEFKCSVGNTDGSYYYDDDHLSLAGAARVADQITSLLR